MDSWSLYYKTFLVFIVVINSEKIGINYVFNLQKDKTIIIVIEFHNSAPKTWHLYKQL